MLPFTTDQFITVFEQYNTAIWPLQPVAYLLGLIAIGLSVRPTRQSDRIISAILVLFWVWMGAVYHLTFFRQISPAAVVFGALFIVQGILFLLTGVVRGNLTFRAETDNLSIVGWVLVLYALVVYPLIGAALGHEYPRSPVFGVAPCPTTIFTFGLLLWTRAAFPKYLLIIPVAWALIGSSAAVAFGIGEDVGLVVAGLLSAALLIRRERRRLNLSEGWRQRLA